MLVVFGFSSNQHLHSLRSFWHVESHACLRSSTIIIKKNAHAATRSIRSLGLRADILGSFAPSCFALAFPVALLPKSCSITWSLCSLMLCACFLVTLLHRASCFALAFLVALLPQASRSHSRALCSLKLCALHWHSQSLRSLQHHARVLGRFAPSSFGQHGTKESVSQ